MKDHSLMALNHQTGFFNPDLKFFSVKPIIGTIIESVITEYRDEWVDTQSSAQGIIQFYLKNLLFTLHINRSCNTI